MASEKDRASVDMTSVLAFVRGHVGEKGLCWDENRSEQNSA